MTRRQRNERCQLRAAPWLPVADAISVTGRAIMAHISQRVSMNIAIVSLIIKYKSENMPVRRGKTATGLPHCRILGSQHLASLRVGSLAGCDDSEVEREDRRVNGLECQHGGIADHITE